MISLANRYAPPLGWKVLLRRNCGTWLARPPPGCWPGLAREFGLVRRVLIAEDDLAIQRLRCDYLRDEGFEGSARQQRAEALHQAHTAPPDVAIVDAMMPVMDARPMLDTWSQDLKLRTVSRGRRVRRAGSAGPGSPQRRATLAKPFDLDVLRAILDLVVAHPAPPPDTPVLPGPE